LGTSDLGNLAVPRFILPNFGIFLKKTSDVKCVHKKRFGKGWGRLPPAGLGKGRVNWIGKVRLG